MNWKSILVVLALALGITGCDLLGQNGPQALPTVVLDSKAPSAATPAASYSTGGVTASGIVVPAREIRLGFAAAGRVETLSVAVGDAVKAGQVLARLAGNAQLQAALSAAELSVLSIQQDLDRLQKNAGLEAALAQQAVADAQKALQDAANNRYAKNLARVSQATIDAAQAALIIAKDELKNAQENYDKFVNRPEDDVMRAQAFNRLAAARQKVDQLQYNLDWLIGRPDPVEVAQADATIALAQARLKDAQARYDRLKNGPDADQTALLQARLKNAQDQVEAARANLANLELKAPYAGIVTALNMAPGEMVSAGQVLIITNDTTQLRVETTDLSELDVPKVKADQPVRVSIKALNQAVGGKVSAIAPLSGVLGGDVVYKVTVVLDSLPVGLRPGMSVEVQFQ